MDAADRRMASDAEYHALEFGQPGSSTAEICGDELSLLNYRVNLKTT